MNQFNLGQFINKFINYPTAKPGGQPTDASGKAMPPSEQFEATLLKKPQPQHTASMRPTAFDFKPMYLQEYHMNNIEGLEKSLYMKDLMNLPKEMTELLKNLQKANLQNLDAGKLLAKNINLEELSLLFQQNGKDAVSKLVMAMSNAAKQGINDLSQLKDMMRLINASVSMAGEKDPSMALKSLILLYLPWLPLQEGIDFTLEFEAADGGASDSESSLTIMISTKNYGNLKATLILDKEKSISVIINCSEKFPKDELLKRINTESKNHSMQTNIIVEQKETKVNEEAHRQAKVDMVYTTEINPFLLLMAHSIIRHTIEIDNQAG